MAFHRLGSIFIACLGAACAVPGPPAGPAPELVAATSDLRPDLAAVGRDDGRRGGEHAAIVYRSDRFERVATADFRLGQTSERPSKGWDARCCNRLASWVQLRRGTAGHMFFDFSVPVGTFNGCRHEQPVGDCIDPVFVGPRWPVLGHRALDDRHEGRFASDPLPLAVRLRLP